ncbi:MAG: response regulator, partial [Burkholderiales bacterium]|nr:response regulator [Burkholderiales bacterium]
MIDRDIHFARALVIDGNTLLRNVAAAQLRDMGIGKVVQTARMREARLLLEREAFDIVICNREVEGSEVSGQDLLDELRRERQLAYGTVFMMVTSQARYSEVVEAAEASLDGLLVRPYTGALLAERLVQARQRKRELADLLQALDAQQFENALVIAVRRFQARQPHWVYCGRLAAELLLRLDRAAQARQVFERLAEAQGGAAWARLGVVRALVALGETASARRAVTELIEADAGSADAHDLLGRILVEQCDFDGALEQYRSAAELTPGCLLRAQHAGALAFYQGEAESATALLERAIGLGVQSKLFDALTLLMLAMLRLDRGDAPGLASMAEQLRRYRERFPQSARLLRFEGAASVLTNLLARKPEAALQALAALSGQAGEADFDLEAANIVLALWARVPPENCPAAEREALVERIGMRFCTSKALAEVLAASARRAEPALGGIRRCQAQVSALTQRALESSMHGDPAGAVHQLLEAGRSTLNAKFLEMAATIAERHAAAVPDAPALAAQARALLERSCAALNHIAGIQRSGRSPGGLQLRAPAPAAAAAPSAPLA